MPVALILAKPETERFFWKFQNRSSICGLCAKKCSAMLRIASLVVVVVPRKSEISCDWFGIKIPHIVASLLGRLLHSLCSRPSTVTTRTTCSGIHLVGNLRFPPFNRSPAGMVLQNQRKACMCVCAIKEISRIQVYTRETVGYPIWSRY